MTSLDFSATNPNGQRGYQWTNWADVFRPQLGAQLQPTEGQTQGPTQSGQPLPSTDAGILGARNDRRNSIASRFAAPKSIFDDVTDQPTGGFFDSITDLPPDGTAPAAQPLAFASAPGTNRDFMPNGLQTGGLQTGGLQTGTLAPPIRPRNVNKRFGSGGPSLRF